jgi:hypothetical protein
MLLVEIEKPEQEPLSKWFSELRDWFDASHCASSTFACTGRRLDRLTYRISFEDAALAHQFLSAFERYSPIIQCATPFERGQLQAMALAMNVPAGAAD